MDELKVFGVIFLLAFLVESLTEYAFGQVFKNVPKLTPYSWTLMYIAMVVGIVGAFIYRFDLLYITGTIIQQPTPITAYGIILTGAGIGRGSNYLHDIVSRYLTKPDKP